MRRSSATRCTAGEEINAVGDLVSGLDLAEILTPCGAKLGQERIFEKIGVFDAFVEACVSGTSGPICGPTIPQARTP
jgi:hypothetical protein